MKVSQKARIRKLFTSNPEILFSIDDIHIMLRIRPPLIRQYISQLRNPNYTDPALTITQVQCTDGKKRWGTYKAVMTELSRESEAKLITDIYDEENEDDAKS